MHSHKRTLIFSWTYTLSEFCGILPIGVALHVQKWGVGTIVLQYTASSTSIFSMQLA